MNVNLDQLLDEENKEILTPAIRFLSKSGMNYEVHTFSGNPAHIITSYASEHNYEGSKGIIKEALLRSVNKVSQLFLVEQFLYRYMITVDRHVGVVLEIDKETHIIEDVEVTFITRSSLLDSLKKLMLDSHNHLILIE